VKLLRGASIPFVNGTRKADVLYDERIEAILPCGEGSADEVTDATGCLLLPGAIDSHVHFNDPGFPEHEDFASGTAAAAAGGVTTVVDMPCTSLPPVVTVPALENKLHHIAPKAYVDYALWGGVNGGEKPHIDELWHAGVVGIKLYTVSGMHTYPALDYIAIGLLLDFYPHVLQAFHAEDPAMLAREAAIERDWTDFAQWSAMRPAKAELLAVQLILNHTRGRVHIVHVGAAAAAQAILIARRRGVDVTWETAPHYLAFTANDLRELRGRLKTAPPVKTPADRDFLRACLIDGRLDWVASDHAGCNWATEKTSDDLREVYNGIPGVQWQLPWLASEFLSTGLITPARLAEVTSGAPARRLGLYPRKGCLAPGSDADFVLLDCSRPWVANEQNLLCRGKYSPFNGRTFACRVARTIVRGRTVYEDGAGLMGERGWGMWQRRISS